MVLIRVTAFFQAEELKIVNEMKDGHADEGHAPKKIDKRYAGDFPGQNGRPAGDHISGLGFLSASPPSTSPRHDGNFLLTCPGAF